MRTTKADVIVRLLGDATGFTKAMKKAQWEAASLSKKFAIVGAQTRVIGKSMTRHMTVPIAALGAASVYASVKVDKAYASIRTGTGETGKALEGLEASFQSVAKNSTQGIDEVASAIADLNTRLGLTGKPLEEVTTQFLKLARVTGTDVAGDIRLGTRLFGDWSIASKDQASSLDLVYRATQQSGIGLNDLMETIVQFGAPLRNMGFDFGESVAMLAKWEKEGVNTSTVLTGMKFALKTFAKAGKDPQKALEKLIPKIRDTTDEQEAMALGMQTFGLRAGPDMVAAIREGRFEYADFAEEIANGKDTISDAAKDSETLADRMAKLKNRAMLVGAEIGDMLIPIIEKLAEYVGRAVEWFGNLSDGWKKAILIAAGVLAALGPIVTLIGTLATVIGFVISPIGLVVLAIAAVAAGLVILYQRSETFRKICDYVWGTIKILIGQAATAVGWVIEKMRGLWGWIKDHKGAIGSALKVAFAPIYAAYKVAQQMWALLQRIAAWRAKGNMSVGGGAGGGGGGGGVRAEGGIVTRPEVSLIGEAGPEAIIPLTRPNRAAEVLAAAGLLGGDTIVNVFLDGRLIEKQVTKRQTQRLRRLERGYA